MGLSQSQYFQDESHGILPDILPCIVVLEISDSTAQPINILLISITPQSP